MRPALQFVHGQRFGALVVIAFTGVEDVDGRRHGTHRVRCDCGVELVVRSSDLRRGASSSCGCKKREKFGRALAKAGPRPLWLSLPPRRPPPESLRRENLPMRPPARKVEP